MTIKTDFHAVKTANSYTVVQKLPLVHQLFKGHHHFHHLATIRQVTAPNKNQTNVHQLPLH